jgi:hypothetical protein
LGVNFSFGNRKKAPMFLCPPRQSKSPRQRV